MPKIAHIFILFLFIGNTYAQEVISSSNNSGKLPWVNGDLPANSNYINYKVVQGEGTQLPIAQNQAIQNLIFELGIEQGVSINSETVNEVEEKIKNNDSQIKSTYNNKVTIVQDGFSATFSKIDEYYEKIREDNGMVVYRLWQLYAIGDNVSNLPKLKYTSKYGFSAGLRSAIIPGWGQLYKKHTAKGFIFMGVEVASIGTAIYFQSQYNYNMNRSEETPTLDIKKEYVSRAQDNATYRNIAIGASIATWVWSVVDAIATEGKPKYANNKVKFNFTSTDRSDLAFAIRYNF